jgi:hypothetical protein
MRKNYEGKKLRSTDTTPTTTLHCLLSGQLEMVHLRCGKMAHQDTVDGELQPLHRQDGKLRRHCQVLLRVVVVWPTQKGHHRHVVQSLTPDLITH